MSKGARLCIVPPRPKQASRRFHACLRYRWPLSSESFRPSSPISQRFRNRLPSQTWPRSSSPLRCSGTMSAEAAEEERMSAVKRIPATKLLFHSPSHQQTYEHRTIVSNLLQLKALPQADRATFKAPADVDEDSVFALFCTSTIFHPQGGGQPSDVGEIIVNGSHPYEVITARTSATNPGTVMHFGRFILPRFFRSE